MSHDSRIGLTTYGLSLSRLVFGAWRLPVWHKGEVKVAWREIVRR